MTAFRSGTKREYLLPVSKTAQFYTLQKQAKEQKLGMCDLDQTHI